MARSDSEMSKDWSHVTLRLSSGSLSALDSDWKRRYLHDAPQAPAQQCAAEGRAYGDHLPSRPIMQYSRSSTTRISCTAGGYDPSGRMSMRFTVTGVPDTCDSGPRYWNPLR